MYFASDALEFPSSPPRIRKGFPWIMSWVAVPCFLKWGIADVRCVWTEATETINSTQDRTLIRDTQTMCTGIIPRTVPNKALI
jgi:hypothetical protein